MWPPRRLTDRDALSRYWNALVSGVSRRRARATRRRARRRTAERNHRPPPGRQRFPPIRPLWRGWNEIYCVIWLLPV